MSRLDFAGDWCDLDSLLSFPSTNAITDYFVISAKTSIHEIPLKTHADRHFILSAYPYSGLDTIDVYCFVKHGTVWRIQLAYFALHPSNRKLSVAEGADRIDVLDGGKVLFSFTPMRNGKVSSVTPDEQRIVADLLSQLPDANHKPYLVSNQIGLPLGMYEPSYEEFASRLRRSYTVSTKPRAVAACVDNFLIRNAPGRSYAPVTARSPDVEWLSSQEMRNRLTAAPLGDLAGLDATRYFQVSVPGTDSQKTWAVVYVGSFYCSRKAYGMIYLLRNTGGRWVLDCELGPTWAF